MRILGAFLRAGCVQSIRRADRLRPVLSRRRG